MRSIKEEITARPTLFEYFDGVSVEWLCLHEQEKASIQEEAAWLRRQGPRIHVDLSSGINLYPTLRLTDNLTADYAASVAAVSNLLAKMQSPGESRTVEPAQGT
ncbi:MAG: hypothetical protein NTU53_02430 [Planctomycetota bacterium]|nr:hypothetical protein [Planctomycetota bacterium]